MTHINKFNKSDSQACQINTIFKTFVRLPKRCLNGSKDKTHSKAALFFSHLRLAHSLYYINFATTFRKETIMAKEFFPGIGKIRFEGKESRHPLAFR